MQDLSNILVTTDFSPNATKALVYGVNLAEQINAKIHILYVNSDESALTEAEIQNNFEDLKYDHLFRCKGKTEFITREGNVLDEIRSVANEYRIDLLIVGMRGANVDRDGTYGSITVNLIDEPPCAIISVPSKSRILGFKQIAIASDNQSIPSENELYVLSYLMQAFLSRASIFHVKNEVTVPAMEDDEVRDSFGELFKYNLRSYAEVEAESLVQTFHNFTDENDIDLLAVFHHITNRGPLKRSVSKQLAFTAQLPLLIIPVK